MICQSLKYAGCIIFLLSFARQGQVFSPSNDRYVYEAVKVEGALSFENLFAPANFFYPLPPPRSDPISSTPHPMHPIIPELSPCQDLLTLERRKERRRRRVRPRATATAPIARMIYIRGLHLRRGPLVAALRFDHSPQWVNNVRWKCRMEWEVGRLFVFSASSMESKCGDRIQPDLCASWIDMHAALS